MSFEDDLLLFCRRDEISACLLYDCFKEFSAASGLIENQTKSSIYFGGVPANTQQAILYKLLFSLRQLPFKYLGVPLSIKKLAVAQCQPLLEKMIGKITSWTV